MIIIIGKDSRISFNFLPKRTCLIFQKKKKPMKSCPGGKAEVFPEGGLEFEPNCA